MLKSSWGEHLRARFSVVAARYGKISELLVGRKWMSFSNTKGSKYRSPLAYKPRSGLHGQHWLVGWLGLLLFF